MVQFILRILSIRFIQRLGLKGARTVGDTIAFQLPQAIFSEEDFSTGEPKYGYLYRIHVGTKNGKETYVPIEGKENQVLKYVWRNDSLIKTEDNVLIGMTNPDGSWNGIGDLVSSSTVCHYTNMAPSSTETVKKIYILFQQWRQRNLRAYVRSGI